jgi:hypothetical protein
LGNLSVDIYSGAELNPEQWDAFIRSSPQGAVYALHGYATALVRDWGAAVVSQGNEWLAVMPFVSKQKFGLKYSLQPLFCQYWGVFFAPNDEAAYQRLGMQRKCLEMLLPVFEPFRLVKYRLSPASEYLLPFHWSQFKLAPRFTYMLDISSSHEVLQAQLASSLKRQIKKQEKFKLKIEVTTDERALIELIEKQQREGHDILGGAKNGIPLLKKLIEYLLSTSSGEILKVSDENGNVLASGLFAYFQSSCLYLIGSYDSSQREKGAMSQLMWHAILQAKGKACTIFDFEGSMIESIEGFFRKFGASPKTYFEISKNTLPLPLRWMEK